MKKQRKTSKSLNRTQLRNEFYEKVESGELNLRQAIREFRIMTGKNQREFAKFVGVSPRVLMAFEQGKGNPTLSTVKKMLKGSGLELSVARRKRP